MMKRKLSLSVTLFFALYASAAIIVPVDTNRIYAAAASAAYGDTLLLTTGEYIETSTIELTKPLTIMAAKNAQPVLKMGKRIHTTSSLNLCGLQIIGNGVAEAVRLLPAGDGTMASLSMKNCTIQGYQYDGATSRIIRVYDASQATPYVDSISIDNCLFRMEGAIRAVEATKAEAQLRHLRITRSTFDGGTGTNRILYLQSTQGSPIESVVIDHCTFYNSTESRAV